MDYNNLSNILIWLIIIIVLIIIAVLFIPSRKNKKKLQADNRKYTFTLETTKGALKFYNPFVNFLIYGGANSGKTKSIGKPLIEEYIKNEFAGLIYDYKDFDLTKTAYHLVEKHNYPYKYYYISFTDMCRTYRTNIIAPKVLTNSTLFIQILTDLFDGLNRGSKKDEWYTGALGILKGTAIRFFNEYSDICTIPHITYFICSAGKKKLTEFLKGSSESRVLSSAFLDSEDSERTQASYLSSLTNYLADIANNKNIAWVLSGSSDDDDYFEFNLIDPNNPKLCSVANSYQIESAISPIISVMVAASARQFSLLNKIPFAYILDEATTTMIPEFEKMPSVLREYKVSFTLLTQSSSKIEKIYGKMDRASIESNFGNQFYGRTMDVNSLKNYQELFGKEDRRSISRSSGRTATGSSQSKTVSSKKEERFDTKIFTDLKSGEFIGTASDANVKDFWVRFKMYQDDEQNLPIVKQVMQIDIDRNYNKIRESLSNLI